MHVWVFDGLPMGLWVWVMGRDLYPLGTHAEVDCGGLLVE